MNKILKLFGNPIIMFGLLAGMTFIVASLIFVAAEKPIALNMQINNIILTLSIISTFLGVRKYREEQPGGFLSYASAFKAGFIIVLISSLSYALYTLILYSASPELLDAFRQSILASMKEIYGSTSYYEPIKENLPKLITPVFIAFSELFQKLFYGTLFALLLAAILKRKYTPQF